MTANKRKIFLLIAALSDKLTLSDKTNDKMTTL